MNRRSPFVRLAAVEAVEARRLFAVAAPVVDGIANYDVPIGKTLQIPITATSDDALTYSVRDSSADVIATFHPNTNTFVEMDVAGYADPMVFELFNDVAPDTVRRFTGLVNAGFYNGLTFNRVVNNFVIQGGSPDGTDTGAPQFKFDDEFNPSDIFSGDGQLAMANSGKDTNGSQFFITQGPQRLLDFNHTIFGQLVRGQDTRDAISTVPVTDPTSDAPATPIVITDMRAITDTTDGVLQVQVDAAGSYNIKVNGTGVNGSDSRSFTVSGIADTVNDPPILDTSKLQPVYYTSENTPISIQLSAIDPDGGSLYYDASKLSTNSAGIGDSSGILNGSGLLTVAPVAGFTGDIDILVGVSTQKDDPSRGSIQADTSVLLDGTADTQVLHISVGGAPLRATGYAFDSDSAAVTKGVTVATFRSASPTAAASDFTASIDWGDGTVTDGVIARNRNGSFAVYGSKLYGAAAAGTLPITVTVDGVDGALSTAETTTTVRSYASLANGILSIYGTSTADRIGIGRKGAYYAVTVNGQTRAFAVSDVTLITAYGLGGNDSITETPTGVVGSYLDGGDGNDVLTGSDGNDTISGGDGNDTIYCNGGNDKAAGGAGNDTIFGGDGNDHLDGGDGNDYIDGGAGRDIITGDDGNDTLLGGTSNDTIYGGLGNDVINGMSGADYLDGGPGTNVTKPDSADTQINFTP